jgi:hypothetical protein
MSTWKNVKWMAILAVLILAVIGAITLGSPDGSFAQETVDAASDVTTTEVDSVEDFDEQSPIELWELVSVILLPWIVQIVKSRNWNDEQSRFALFVAAVITTLIASYLRDELTLDYSIPAILKVALLSQAAYQSILKMSGVAGVTAYLGSLRGGPTVEAQRAGYQGVIAETPPPV